MNIFLRLKHWQLFPVFIAYYVLQILYVVLFGSKSLEFIATWNIRPVMTLVSFVSVLFQSLWILVLAQELNKRQPLDLRMKLSPFIVLFIIKVGHSFLSTTYILFSNVIDMPGLFEKVFDVLATSYGGLRAMVIFNYFCVFYFAYFVSKSLVLAEEQRKITFSEHFGSLLGLVFYAIGIWFIQPRVNKLFSYDAEYNPDAPLDQQVKI